MDGVFSFPAWKMFHLQQIGPRVNLAIQSLPTTVLLGEKKHKKETMCVSKNNAAKKTCFDIFKNEVMFISRYKGTNLEQQQ